VLDPDDRMLLCQFRFVDATGRAGPRTVWAAPGGGVEIGEPPLSALRRELDEEIGLSLDAEPRHVWRQKVIAAGHAAGYDGVINDYYLVRTVAFTPRGSMTDDQLAAENVAGFRWWTQPEIAGYRGPAVFAPGGLGAALATLLADGPPDEPTTFGL
jgi:8-oxo-dGTP pyrophosphatase MutT (NUDIX family)